METIAYDRRALPAVLKHWARFDVSAHALRAVNHETTRVVGSAPQSREPLPVWVLDVSNAVARLPERSRRVLVLYYRRDYSDAEVARAIGLHPQTAHRLRHRALDELAELLAPGAPAAPANG